MPLVLPACVWFLQSTRWCVGLYTSIGPAYVQGHASSVILSLLRCACGTQQAHAVVASTCADMLRRQTQAWLRVSCTQTPMRFLKFCKVPSRWFYWEDPHCRLGQEPCLRRTKQHCVLGSVVQEFAAGKFLCACIGIFTMAAGLYKPLGHIEPSLCTCIIDVLWCMLSVCSLVAAASSRWSGNHTRPLVVRVLP
jgi:hypothetical protein